MTVVAWQTVVGCVWWFGFVVIVCGGLFCFFFLQSNNVNGLR